MKKLSENAISVLERRYLWRNTDGELIETPEGMFRRVAKALGNTKEEEQAFFEVMSNLDFLPNSPTLMNAGKPGGQLSACFVIDVPDSMEGICDALKKQMLIHKSGGGTGFNFSKLRRKGAVVNSTNGVASGPVSFMSLFNTATDVVQQGGMRRGANMGILNCDHPDIEEFIKAKTKDDKLQNFNISVGITDSFMQKVKEDPSSREAKLFDLIATKAWETGDPGLLFFDEINRCNTTPWLGPLEIVNPCGETPLYDGEACNLGSINLSNFVTDNFDSCLPFNNRIDLYRLTKVISTAVILLNRVIDKNNYPLPGMKEAVDRTRKIGLGIMGWAEMLFQLGVRYGSAASLDIAKELMLFIQYQAKAISEENNFNNSTITCIAPTGTISLIADCSSGIEPLFALEHVRVAFEKEGKEKEKRLIYRNKWYEKLKDKYPPSIFVTAHDITFKEHVLMQAAFQKYTDLAVSKTINLPNTASIDDIKEAYMLAWSTHCKGITVYRDGCKSSQVLYTVDEEAFCPDCGSALEMIEGCKKCPSCGWSACSV